MKLLHTGDWHVGKAIRGHSRADEHRAVLAEVATIAAHEEVDLVVVAGDLYETATPTPESDQIVFRALLDLARVAPVVVVAGNHDNARRLSAVAPLLDLGRVHLVAEPSRPDEGGLLSLEPGGTPVRLAMLPFVSQRAIVRAEQLLGGAAHEKSQTYGQRMREVLGELTVGFADDAVNLIVAHLFVDGGLLGGGERSGHTIFDYAVPTAAFPSRAQYVALGHLHRAQALPAPCPVRYAGSPLALDFGEEDDVKSVTVVEATPGVPVKARLVELTAGRALRTVEGTVEQLRGLSGTTGDDWLRLRVRERLAAGLADQLREWFPHAVDIQLVRPDDERHERERRERIGRAPNELFAEYLASVDVDDERVNRLFDELLEQVQAGDA